MGGSDQRGGADPIQVNTRTSSIFFENKSNDGTSSTMKMRCNNRIYKIIQCDFVYTIYDTRCIIKSPILNQSAKGSKLT
jgi:hypothetical protein